MKTIIASINTHIHKNEYVGGCKWNHEYEGDDL